MRKFAMLVAVVVAGVLVSPVPASAAVEGLRVRIAPIAPAAPGTVVTMSGTVEKLENGVWSATPDTDSVAVSFVADQVVTRTSGGLSLSAGAFSWTFTLRRTTKITVTASAYGRQAQAGVTALPNVKQPFKLTFSKFSINAWGKVSMHGWASTIPLGGVELQHRARGTSTWRTIKTFAARRTDFTTPNFYFGQSGYFRLHYKGDNDLTATSTGTKFVLRWTTRLSARWSPKSLRLGNKVTVTGQLRRYWPARNVIAGWSGRNVQLAFRCRGEKTWYSGGWVKTGAKGRFTKRSKTYCDAHWSVVFWGTKDTWGVDTKGIWVNTYGAQALAAPLPAQTVPAPPAPAGTAAPDARN